MGICDIYMHTTIQKFEVNIYIKGESKDFYMK